MLALFALAINIGLSFGHVHVTYARHAGNGLTLQIEAVSPDADRTKGHPRDQADYLCPVCTAVSTIANAIAPAPPVLPVEVVGVYLDRSVETLLTLAKPPTAAFQSRAPPVS